MVDSQFVWVVVRFQGLSDLTYLRSHERSRVTRRHQQAIFCSELFGKSKITNPDAFCTATVIGVADVTGLQVSMYNLKKGQEHTFLLLSPYFILETTQQQQHVDLSHPQ